MPQTRAQRRFWGQSVGGRLRCPECGEIVLEQAIDGVAYYACSKCPWGKVVNLDEYVVVERRYPMAISQKDTSTIPEVGDPQYWIELGESLNQAKRLLWARVQRGLYHDDKEAKATMEAYWAVKNVLKLQENKMRQIPLPEEERTDGHR